MNDLISLVKSYFPQTAKLLTSVAFLVFLILNISDDFNKITNLIKKIFDYRKHIDTLIYSRKRKAYNKKLYDKDFLSWQLEIMKKIYEPLINKKNDSLNKQFNGCQEIPHISLTKLCFCDKFIKEYEAITISAKPVDFPFKDICPKESNHLERMKEISNEKYPYIQKKYKRFIKKYYRIIEQTIKYPKRLGYMLDKIEFYKNNNQVEWYLDSYVGNYENNLKTSHVLEYELYKLYIKDKKNHLNIKKKCIKDILEELPIRRYIHNNFENEYDVLTLGNNRSSLLGVQIFVMIKNHNEEYDALRIRRSENVATKPGFLQFIPSG
ncbi:MAG: hypothetical protein ACTTIX_08735 [Peptoanaerobacter stomatis]